MLYNYFIIAIRNLKKRKLYSFINIFGLAIGVAVCLVILKYVDFELSYDSFHQDANNIYRTNDHGLSEWGDSRYESDLRIQARPVSFNGYSGGKNICSNASDVWGCRCEQQQCA